MTPTRTTTEPSRWSQFWKASITISVLSFPVATGAGSYFAAKVLEHDKDIAVMRASYTTKDDTASREDGLKKSLDELRQTINDLKIEIVKIAEVKERG